MSEKKGSAAAAAEQRVEWLRSQLIGKDVEFDTPFGRRLLTYADQTASGRSLRYIEDYLVKEVLPFYVRSGPYVKIDMKSGEVDGYDAVFLSPHKFVGGPGTPGILLMNKSLYRLNSQPPSMCGGGTVAYVNGFNEEDTLYYDDIEEREDAGTPPIVQKIRTSLAFWVKEYIGYDTMELHERVYSEMAMKRLINNPNIKVLGNTTVDRLPIFSFLIYPPVEDSLFLRVEPGCYNSLENKTNKILPLHGRFVTKLLNDLFGIQARGGCACAGPYGHILLDVDNELSLRIRSAILEGYSGLKPGWTRLSFAYYLSKEEFKFILSAIEFIAAYGHRFLPLYKFDWITGNWTFREQAIKYHVLREELSLATSVQYAENIKSKIANNLDKKPEPNHMKFETYLENARKIARSLPNINQQIVSIPKGVDPDMVLFHI
uniref:Aminotransferase class V domain-containing protein n=1 Tax=Oryza punctata TaxID=4537 RepID=A0A0E0MKG5_ORYPU